MREIRRVQESDMECLKTIYEKVFEKYPGVMMYYQGFHEYDKL